MKLIKNLWDPSKIFGQKQLLFCQFRKKEIDEFYYGLSNKALWPLFHYFIEYSVFNINQWESYVDVNKKFSEAVIKNVEDGDIIWVHDYQLLLCPKMIRDVNPNVTIGFSISLFHHSKFLEFFLERRITSRNFRC